MEIIFPTKMGSIHQERSSYPIICMLQGGKAVSQFPGLGCVFVSLAGTPGVLLGRLFCIRKGGSATAGIPDRVFLSGLTSLSCPSTQKCRLLSLLGIGGVVGLWSREGCGVGPNLHSVVTSTGASATAGISDRRLLSGLTSLSWAPSTSFFHDIQAIFSHTKASPSTTGQSFPCTRG